MDYFIKGIQVEETINEAKQLIDFQKVVRVSSKYKHVLHDDKKLMRRYYEYLIQRIIQIEGFIK